MLDSFHRDLLHGDDGQASMIVGVWVRCSVGIAAVIDRVKVVFAGHPDLSVVSTGSCQGVNSEPRKNQQGTSSN